MTTTKYGYKWLTWGDLNAFWGLMLDNVTNLVLFASILSGVFGYPSELIFTKMIPGTALGVLVGDLVYTWMAFNLAKKTGNKTVTAMPLGLDAPSTIGMAFAVLGPAYLATGKNAELTWQIGMAVMIFIGIVKLICSFLGPYVQRVIPQAGLLGSLAGIGIALLAFLPLIDILKMPIVGMISLGIILYTVVAKLRLPKNLPSIFIAVLVGTIIYYVTGYFGLLGLSEFKTPEIVFRLAFPIPTLGFLEGLQPALPYLAIAIPFGLLTVVGGINVTESARVAGDDFNTRDILLTEAIATLIAGLCGGVAQSTPYIGQPAYKSMGARAGYTLATGLFIGLGGILGYVSFVVDLIPAPAVAGILIFVGLDIVSQAFEVCPIKHYPAIGFSFLPTIADLVLIQISNLQGQLMDTINKIPGIQEILAKHPVHLPHELETSITVITALGHGFILTAMLWGAVLAFLIDKELTKAIITLLVCAIFTYFGIIHSVLPSGGIYLPWTIDSSLPYYFTIAYICFALFVLLMKVSIPKDDLDAKIEH